MSWDDKSGIVRQGRTLPDPLVTVVTPVYNGARTLDDCIASVLDQSYANWTLIVVDNASTDESVAIAAAAAVRDPRIRVERHPEHLGMLDHWNRALSHAPDDALYLKQLNVDDRLHGECLRRLVDVAEAHPEAGVVSSYFTYGSQRLPQLEHDQVQIVGGQDVVREVMFGRPSYLAHPSVMLLRRKSVANWPSLFNATGFPAQHPAEPPLCQADKEAYFDVVERTALAFVPEVLSDICKHDGSATGFSSRVGGWHPSRIEAILRHGNRFLAPADRRLALRSAARKYLRSLVWRCCKGIPLRDPEFVLFQRLALSHLLPPLQKEDLGWVVGALGLLARTLDQLEVNNAGTAASRL